jgi:hypothetical protein
MFKFDLLSCKTYKPEPELNEVSVAKGKFKQVLKKLIRL